MGMAQQAIFTFVATAQIVGQTCGPSGCNPVFAPLPKSLRPFISSVAARCGTLSADVYLLNDEGEPLPSNPVLWDVALTVNGKAFHPELRTVEPMRQIAPGAFVGPVRYAATIPQNLFGSGRLSVGPLPAIEVLFDTLNSCP